jgi:hypothetical protein
MNLIDAVSSAVHSGCKISHPNWHGGYPKDDPDPQYHLMYYYPYAKEAEIPPVFVHFRAEDILSEEWFALYD